MLLNENQIYKFSKELSPSKLLMKVQDKRGLRKREKK